MPAPLDPPAETTTPRRATGPRTARGKHRCRRNATRHGLRATRVRLTPAEKGRFYRKIARYLAAFKAPDEAIRTAARQAAHAAIMLDRVQSAFATCPDGADSPAALRLLLRHEPAYRRLWLDALTALAER